MCGDELYTCFDSLTIEIQGAIILEIGLKQRVCELYPSQHQDVTDNTVKVEFELEREMEIAQAVGKTFCFTEVSL